MKRTPIKKVGKVGARRAKGMAKWKREHPVPAFCPICGRAPDFRGMAAHHRRHRSQGGDESEKNLVWLDGDCHDKTHGGGVWQEVMEHLIDKFLDTRRTTKREWAKAERDIQERERIRRTEGE